MTKEIKKETPSKFTKTTMVARPKLQFVFGRKNYIILLSGIGLMLIGYLILSGGGSNDPNKFSPELFSFSRMVTAPIILLLGFVTVGVSIMYHPKN